MSKKRDNRNGFTKGAVYVANEGELDSLDLDSDESREVAASIIGSAVVVSIDVPLSEDEPVGQPTRKVEFRMHADEAMTLRRLRDALYLQHARRSDGRHVESVADAVRWLIGRAGGLIPSEQSEVSEV